MKSTFYRLLFLTRLKAKVILRILKSVLRIFSHPFALFAKDSTKP